MSGYPIPPLLAPDPEDLGMYYYTPLLSPTLIDTREPDVKRDEDTIHGFVTIESAGISRVDIASYNVSTVYHCYSPVEAQASDLSRTIMAYGTAIQGKSVMGWLVMGLVSAIGGQKLPNPNVDLPRYRCALTWRVQGRPVGSSGIVVPPPVGGGGTTPGVYVFGEVVQPNGIDKVFYLANYYVASTVSVYLNGVRQLKGVDYNETGSGRIAFIVTPTVGDSVIVDYQIAS